MGTPAPRPCRRSLTTVTAAVASRDARAAACILPVSSLQRPASRAPPELAACAPRLPDDGGDGDKTPLGAHATAGREESGRSSVAGELRGLAALLPSARSERSNGQAAMPMLLAATNGAIVSVRRSKVGCAWAVEGSRPPLAKERSGESDSL